MVALSGMSAEKNGNLIRCELCPLTGFAWGDPRPPLKTIALCALYCPMQGILWDYRGCTGGDSPYNDMTYARTYEARNKYIFVMLTGFKELKSRCDTIECAEHQGE